MGVKTVNLVRKRDDMNPIVEELTKLGADLVITEEQLLKDYRFQSFSNAYSFL